MCSGMKFNFAHVTDMSFPTEAQLTKLIDAGTAFSAADKRKP